MTKKHYHSCKKFRVEIFSMSKKFPLLKNPTKSDASEQGHFHYENYAQITSKNFHLLFVHYNNKLNNSQIQQIIAMGGSGKTQDFFLC